MEKNLIQQNLQELQETFGHEDFEAGLSAEEAARRLAQDGPNRLESKRTPKWQLFLRQFHNMIIYILMIAAALTLVMGHYGDAAIIALVIVINALIGYYQEANASDALEQIKSLLTPVATVYRDGNRIDIPAEELVKGDVVFLEAGDQVPADLRIVDVDNLRIEEASLTGEADSVEKTNAPLAEELPLAERTNLAFASTSVTNGSGLGIVIATAADTEIGKISTEVANVTKRCSPLMQQIDNLGKGVSYVVLGAAVLLFILGLLWGTYAVSALSLAVVTMIVGSVPEGLPATTSVILAMGVTDMAKTKHTIVKSLPAVETLGSVDVIATDKTGTLTKNEMTVTDVYLPKNRYRVTGNGYAPEGQLLGESSAESLADPQLALFMEAAYEANDTELYCENGAWQINGEPTDGSFLTLYHKLNPFPEQPQNRELDFLPFDSDYRYMAKLVETPDGKKRLYMKGSPDKLLPLASAGDPTFPTAFWEEKVTALTTQGKRVVAVGWQELPDTVTVITPELLQQGIRLLGIAGIIDPPREEVINALKEMRRAGVAVKMITGDHPLTAKTIGEKLGLAPRIRVITGPQWDQLSDEEKLIAAKEHQVFARTTPKNKLEIIEALQADDKVTAMTGDGVNDAPALKRADIGVAMGIKGTDVAKDSADMILADDNFATMAVAIKEGRRIYDNIKKSILFLLPTSFAEGLIIAFTILMQEEMPLAATQLLWINMVSAITIQFAFIFEPAEAGIMDRQPQKTGTSLMDRHDIFQMAYVSVLMAVIGLAAYQWLLGRGVAAATASTMLVNIIVMSKIFYLFNIRTKAFAFSKAFFSNKMAFVIIGIMLLLQILLTYVPFMQSAFHTTDLTLLEWGVAILAGLLTLGVTELDKFIRSRASHTVKANS